MSKKQENVFKCPNDLKINITKSSGEVIIDEECCTAVSIILKNSGELATSFFGAHNPEIVKVLEKSIKMYFKAIKKTLKKDYKNPDEDITVSKEDLKESDKWKGQPVPDLKNDGNAAQKGQSKKIKSESKTTKESSTKTDAMKRSPNSTKPSKSMNASDITNPSKSNKADKTTKTNTTKSTSNKKNKQTKINNSQLQLL